MSDRPISRRHFFQATAGGALLVGLGASFLASCGSSSKSSPATLQLGGPSNPVKLSVSPGNQAIADGLSPEKGPLRIYSWAQYLSPDVLKDFESAFGVTTEVTTFGSVNELTTKLASGAVKPDILLSLVQQNLPKMVASNLVQPLNHSYLANVGNVWSSLRSPFYDVGSVYTVPYVVYTTGIGYRTDHVDASGWDTGRHYDAYWDPKYKGFVALLDDPREIISMSLIRNGVTDVNTVEKSDIDAAVNELVTLKDLVSVKLGQAAYQDLPTGTTHIQQAWSGQMIGAQYLLPEGTDASVLGYWFPADRKGLINNDMLAVPRSAEHPVLAHTFLNYLLDPAVAKKNFGFVGYQPPLQSLVSADFVSEGLVPEGLTSAIVAEGDFDDCLRYLALPVAGEQVWENGYSRIQAG